MPPLTTQGWNPGVIHDFTLFTMFLMGDHFLSIHLPSRVCPAWYTPSLSALTWVITVSPPKLTPRRFIFHTAASVMFLKYKTDATPLEIPSGLFVSVPLFVWYSLISDYSFPAPPVVYFNSNELLPVSETCRLSGAFTHPGCFAWNSLFSNTHSFGSLLLIFLGLGSSDTFPGSLSCILLN